MCEYDAPYGLGNIKAKLSFALSPGEQLSMTLDRSNPKDPIAVERISEAIANALHLPRAYLGGWFFRMMDQPSLGRPNHTE